MSPVSQKVLIKSSKGVALEAKIGAMGAVEDSSCLWELSSLDEEAHYFDFSQFYKKPEFCDRIIRLEILEEGDEGGQVGAVIAISAEHITAEAAGTTQIGGPGEHPEGVSQKPQETAAQSGDKQGPEAVSEGIPKKKKRRRRPGRADEAPRQPEQPAEDSEPPRGVEETGPGGSSEADPVKLSPAVAPPQNGLGASEETAAAKGVAESSRSGGPAAQGAGGALAKRNVEDIPVSSVILAAKSEVLRTMLSSGMKESDKSEPILLKVTEREKKAFKKMLDFIYTGKLAPKTQSKLVTDGRHLLDLLIVGDKFEVKCFVRAVLDRFIENDPTVDSSVALGLEIPDALEQHPRIRRLAKAAREHLVETFKRVEHWPSSISFLTLDRHVVEFLLQSEELEADSEEAVLDGVLVWLKNSFENVLDRREALKALRPHVRFGLIRGEYLALEILPLPEMDCPESQEVVKRGLYFLAYSDDAKRTAAAVDVWFKERRGIQAKRLEIVGNVRLDETGKAHRFATVDSWFNVAWGLSVQRDTRCTPPTVGVFLLRLKTKSKELQKKVFNLSYKSYARSWPDGYWKLLFHSKSAKFGLDGSGLGSSDALKMSWDEAKKSEEFMGCAGELTFKMVIRLNDIEDADSVAQPAR